MYKKIKFHPDDSLMESVKHINSSVSSIPQWYKDSPQFVSNQKTPSLIPNFPTATNSTYKRCSPFLDALSSGYTITLPADLQIFRRPDGNPFFAWRYENLNMVSHHNDEQFEGFEIPDRFNKKVFKWEFRFQVETPPGYSCVFTHPMNRLDLPFQTLSGVVDTDGYPLAVLLPFVIEKDFEGIIDAGTPIAQIIPFKRENWNSEYTKYSSEQSSLRQHKLLSKIVRSYKSQWWKKKIYQ
jgi:hypothetical protein